MKTILVVDDDDDFRLAIVNLLQRWKYRVVEAASGLAGLSILNKSDVDLILSDVRMPGMSGAEFLTEVRKKHAEYPPMILVSGYNELSVEDAYNLGAAGVFAKPFNRQDLRDTIERVILLQDKRWSHRPPRHQADFTVNMRFPEKTTEIHAQLQNIGRGGMFVRNREAQPKIGTSVQFKVDIRVDERNPWTLSGLGVIRWVRDDSDESMPQGYGVEFIFLDEPGRSQIIDVLVALDKRQYIPKI